MCSMRKKAAGAAKKAKTDDARSACVPSLPPMQAGVVASSMQIASYEDVNCLEAEIARLLQCEKGRTPVCLMAEPYRRLRHNLLSQILSPPELPPDDGPAKNDRTLHLEQGLSIIVQKLSDRSATIQLVWREVCNPAAPSEQQLNKK